MPIWAIMAPIVAGILVFVTVFSLMFPKYPKKIGGFGKRVLLLPLVRGPLDPHNYTMSGLRELAKKRGIDPTGMKRSELEQALAGQGLRRPWPKQLKLPRPKWGAIKNNIPFVVFWVLVAYWVALHNFQKLVIRH